MLTYQGHPPGSEARALRSQRSESVKCANLPCTEFLMAPVDVTSKGHLFQKELVGKCREGPASSHSVSGSHLPGIFRLLSLGLQSWSLGTVEQPVLSCICVVDSRGPRYAYAELSQPSCVHSSGEGPVAWPWMW